MIALGHNLDDMAQTIMMNMQNGDLERTLRLAPHTSTPLEGMVPRIVPLTMDSRTRNPSLRPASWVANTS